MENVEYKVSVRASVSAIYRHLPWTITSSHHPTSHFLHLSLHQTSRRSFSLHNTTQHIATHPPPPPPHPTHVHAHSPPFHLPHLALRLTDCANTRTDHRSQITDHRSTRTSQCWSKMDGKRSSIGSVSHSSFDCPFYKPRSKKDTRELTSAVLLWKLELAIVMVPSKL